MPDRTTVRVGGRDLTLSNLAKVLYPETGFTKRDVIDYLVRVAPVLLPHLERRPLSLKRYPDGVDGFSFYEKRCPRHRPAWVRTGTVELGSTGPIDFCLADDAAALAWLGNIACLELHTHLYRLPEHQQPTMMVLDLDPGPPAGLVDCLDLAVQVRDLLERHGLQALPKSSGGKGLHLYVPLNTPTTFAATKAFARALAEHLAREQPQRVVSVMRKDLRAGRILIDWSQNDRAKTTVCAYSLRAQARPTVSTPLTWDEIARARRRRSVDGLVLEAPALLRRLERLGDVFAPVLALRQRLPAFAPHAVV